jgi:hypothetical protein
VGPSPACRVNQGVSSNLGKPLRANQSLIASTKIFCTSVSRWIATMLSCLTASGSSHATAAALDELAPRQAQLMRGRWRHEDEAKAEDAAEIAREEAHAADEAAAQRADPVPQFLRTPPADTPYYEESQPRTNGWWRRWFG